MWEAEIPAHGGESRANRRAVLLGLVISTLAAVLPVPAKAAPSEYHVKAAYLFNFASLVKWPSSVFKTGGSPLVIGIIGTDPFQGGLGSILAGRQVGQRPIEVRSVRATDTAAMRGCHLLFASGGIDAGEIARSVRGSPVLVVGEAEDFAASGGAIGFVLRDSKIKLEINREVARQSGLEIPSDLLAISKLVQSR